MNPDAKVLSWKAAASKTDPGVEADFAAITRAFATPREGAKATATKSTAPVVVASFDC